MNARFGQNSIRHTVKDIISLFQRSLAPGSIIQNTRPLTLIIVVSNSQALALKAKVSVQSYRQFTDFSTVDGSAFAFPSAPRTVL